MMQSDRIYTRPARPTPFATALLCCLSMFCGCGDGLPETIPVRGKVTFKGGAPPGPGTVFFAPLSGNTSGPLRPGSGDFSLDGVFSAATFQGRDGLLPGTYQVRVVCAQTPSPQQRGRSANNSIASFNVPNLTVEAKSPGVVDLKYDIAAK